MDYGSHPVSVVSQTFAALEEAFTGHIASAVCDKLSFTCEGACRHCGMHFSRRQSFSDPHYGEFFCSAVCSSRDRAEAEG